RQPNSTTLNICKLMNERIYATHPAVEDGRGRGKPAHPEHSLRLEVLVNRSAPRQAFIEPAQKTENRGRIKRWEPDRRQLFKAKLRAGGKRERVDFFFRDKKHDFMGTLVQHFGDRDAGETMYTV